MPPLVNDYAQQLTINLAPPTYRYYIVLLAYLVSLWFLYSLDIAWYLKLITWLALLSYACYECLNKSNKTFVQLTLALDRSLSLVDQDGVVYRGTLQQQLLTNWSYWLSLPVSLEDGFKTHIPMAYFMLNQRDFRRLKFLLWQPYYSD